VIAPLRHRACSRAEQLREFRITGLQGLHTTINQSGVISLSVQKTRLGTKGNP
jgi:hypothetical protein